MKHMKQLPKKLRGHLDEFISAVCNQKLDDALHLMEKIDWEKYNRSNQYDLPLKDRRSVLFWLGHQYGEFHRKHPRTNNLFFKKVFQAALDNGFDPYTEDHFWQMANDYLTPELKTITKILDAHPHDNLQHSSLLSYVCSNYLVHPWLLKQTLNLPNASVWLQHETTLFEQIWDGEMNSEADEKEVCQAHQLLMDHDAIISATFAAKCPELIALFDDSGIHAKIKQILEAAQVQYQKNLLLAATASQGQRGVARKM